MDSCSPDSVVVAAVADRAGAGGEMVAAAVSSNAGRARRERADCKVSDTELRESIVAHFGILTYVALAVGLSRPVLYRRVGRVPGLQAAVDGARRVLVQRATFQLREALRAGAEWAVHFFMCREEGVWVPMKSRVKKPAAPAETSSDEDSIEPPQGKLEEQEEPQIPSPDGLRRAATDFAGSEKPQGPEEPKGQEVDQQVVREVAEPQPEVANKVMLRLIRAVESGKPWAVKYCLNHLEPRGRYARKAGGGKAEDAVAEEDETGEAESSLDRSADDNATESACGYDRLIGEFANISRKKAATAAVVADAPDSITAAPPIPGESVLEIQAEENQTSQGVASAQPVSAAQPVMAAPSAPRGTTASQVSQKSAQPISRRQTKLLEIGEKDKRQTRQTFRTWLSENRPWVIDLQVRRLEHEARHGRRPPPEPAEEEEEIDPDDLPAPEDPRYTVAGWRRHLAWKAGPESRANEERYAKMQREWEEQVAAQAAERARIAQQKAEADAQEAEAEAAKAAENARITAEIARVTAGRPQSGTPQVYDGRIIPQARGYPLGLKWQPR